MNSAINRGLASRGITAYFIVAIGFTWSMHFAIAIFDVPFTMDLASRGMQMYLLGLAGPLFAAITVSACQAGGDGVKNLLSQGLRWRFPLHWYLVAILLIPAINLANVLIFYDRIPEEFAWFVINPTLIAGQIWVVLAEEFGWRGFALPRLQARYGSLGATLILGPLWAIWHLPMFFVPGSPQYTENVIASLVVYTSVVVCVSVLFTVIYNRSKGSVLACMLFHAFLNIAAFTIRIPPEFNISIYIIAGVALLSISLLDRPLFRRSASTTITRGGPKLP